MILTIVFWLTIILLLVFMFSSYVVIKKNLQRLKVGKERQLFKSSSRYKSLYITSLAIRMIMPLIILVFLGLIYFSPIYHHTFLNLNYNQILSILSVSLFIMIGIVLGLSAELSGLLENLASQEENN